MFAIYALRKGLEGHLIQDRNRYKITARKGKIVVERSYFSSLKFLIPAIFHCKTFRIKYGRFAPLNFRADNRSPLAFARCICAREEIADKKWNYDRSIRSRIAILRACVPTFARNTRTVLIIARLINKTEERFESAV